MATFMMQQGCYDNVVVCLSVTMVTLSQCRNTQECFQQGVAAMRRTQEEV